MLISLYAWSFSCVYHDTIGSIFRNEIVLIIDLIITIVIRNGIKFVKNLLCHSSLGFWELDVLPLSHIFWLIFILKLIKNAHGSSSLRLCKTDVPSLSDILLVIFSLNYIPIDWLNLSSSLKKLWCRIIAVSWTITVFLFLYLCLYLNRGVYHRIMINDSENLFLFLYLIFLLLSELSHLATAFSALYEWPSLV